VTFEISYFHERVLAEIQSWPVDVVADYARLVEVLMEYGPSLRFPTRERSVVGSSSFVPVVVRDLAVRSTASSSANVS